MGEVKIDFSKSVDVDVVSEEEYWNKYKLEDGTTIKVKIVLRGVKRLEQYEPDGKPIYIINTVNVVKAVDVPQKLIKIPPPSSNKGAIV